MESNTTEGEETKICCDWRRFEGKKKAQGFAFAATGHGSIFMSNVFLSAAFVYLAHNEVGCIDEETDEIIDDCDKRIHGFSPESIVTDIAAIAAILAAFFLPVVGAIIDYTPHRRVVGQVVAFSIFLIQGAQIFTGEQTWFAMAILQAIVGALFEFHYSISSSYLPDLTRYDIATEKFDTFNQIFYALQFGGQVVFLLLVTGISLALDYSSVESARLGQLIGTVWLLVTFTGAWKCFPAMPKRRELPEGHTNVLLEGFRQNWRTAKAINSQSKSLKYFYLAVVFGEAGTSTLLPVAVNLLVNSLGYSATDVGISFLIALISTMPGIFINSRLSKAKNPVFSAMASQIFCFTFSLIAIFVLDGPSTAGLGRVFSGLWGFSLGWWYSSENLLFTIVMPAGQETELSGFFVYCTIILTWVPPLAYSLIVVNGGDPELGLISIVIFELSAVLFLRLLPSWDEILESAKTPLKIEVDEAKAGADIDKKDNGESLGSEDPTNAETYVK